MKDEITINNNITIPGHEIEITASRAGGPGGQHVNKASTRVTVRWNIAQTNALTAAQKTRVMKKLSSHLTNDGDLIIHNSSSRSQHQNKEQALKQLKTMVIKALRVPKKRIKTKIPKTAQEARLQKKAHRSTIKKLRREKISEE